MFLLHEASGTLSRYGFVHITSLAIFIEGISALAPKRVSDLARVGFRTLFAATLTCLMAGAITGVFISANQTILLNFR